MESRASDQPSIWAVAFGASVVAGLAGYFLGTASSIGVFGTQKRVVSSSSSHTGGEKEDGDEDDAFASESDESEDDQEVNSFEDSNEECKLVLVVRTDLGMTKGTYLSFHIFSWQSHFFTVSGICFPRLPMAEIVCLSALV